MANSVVFWNYFKETGTVGSYLLYRLLRDEEQDEEQDIGDVASERG